MPPTFYDTHAHLDYPDFAAELPQVIERAAVAGITKIVSIGTDLDSSRRAIELAERFPAIHAAVGWHPNDALQAPADVRPTLRELVRHPKVVAIGETGLDYYRLPSKEHGGTAGDDARVKQRQAEVFRQQLEVAAECGLNCVIHQRGDCFADTVALLEPFVGRVRFVFHCFVGTPAEQERIVALGGLTSFTGIVTFKNGQTVRESAKVATELMLETDSPFLTPEPYRGRVKRCEPAFVKEIADVVAKTRGCSMEELSVLTCEAAHRFFPRLA
ncbi:MAG TPA: TatD family hydrolase [Verrucomicrobiae bacterium]